MRHAIHIRAYTSLYLLYSHRLPACSEASMDSSSKRRPCAAPASHRKLPNESSRGAHGMIQLQEMPLESLDATTSAPLKCPKHAENMPKRLDVIQFLIISLGFHAFH